VIFNRSTILDENMDFFKKKKYFAEGGALYMWGLDSLLFDLSCFAEGRKKGAMITMREVFSGKYSIQSENQNQTSINIQNQK
jgi:hypothetical protein